jgi:hypothetical protein
VNHGKDVTTNLPCTDDAYKKNPKFLAAQFLPQKIRAAEAALTSQ